MEISSAQIAAIVKKVISGMENTESTGDVPIGVSNRHVQDRKSVV